MQATTSLSDLEKGVLLPKTPTVIPVNYNGRQVQNIAPIVQANLNNPDRNTNIGMAVCISLCVAGFMMPLRRRSLWPM